MAKKPNWIYLDSNKNFESRYYKKLTNLCKSENLDYHKVSQDYNRFEKYDDKGRLFLTFVEGKENDFIKSFQFEDN